MQYLVLVRVRVRNGIGKPDFGLARRLTLFYFAFQSPLEAIQGVWQLRKAVAFQHQQPAHIHVVRLPDTHTRKFLAVLCNYEMYRRMQLAA